MPPTGDAIVVIHDWMGSDREWPRAVVIRPNGSGNEIDILASVRLDAASVGHPAILCAIKRWEEIIICQSALPITGVVSVSHDDAEYLTEETEKERAERLKSGLTGTLTLGDVVNW